MRRSIEIPDEVQRRVNLQGEEGAAWLASLGALVTALEHDWDLLVGGTLPGGSGSIVVEVSTVEGRQAVLKVPMPWLDAERRQLAVLVAARGRGYANLIRHDEGSGAMLLERLGRPLMELGLDIDAQIQAVCATLLEAWTTPSAGGAFMPGDRKAIDLAGFIERTWREQGEPCLKRTIDVALAFADLRRRAFDPEAAVLAHGDAHAGNLLLASGDREPQRFKFVDPEGLFIERAYDLAIPMRDWGAELLAGDPQVLGRKRCDLLARLTGVEPEPIWQWGFIERVSTGLHLKELGWDAWSREYLAVADAWAAGEQG